MGEGVGPMDGEPSGVDEGRILETLNRTGAALSAELDLERLVQMVTDAGVEITGAQFGAFFYNVIDAAGESYMLYTISGVPRAEFESFPMPRNTAVFAPTFEGRGTVRSDDITLDPRYGHNHPRRGMPKGHLPVRSYLAVSVVSRTGEVIGGLFFGHAETGRFSDRHERLLEGIAGQAAVAIDNARLYRAAQNELAQRRRAEAQLRDSEARLRLATQAAAIGTWDFNPVSGELRWDAQCRRLFGLSHNAEVTYDGAFLSGLHPEDRYPTDAAVQAALDPDGPGGYDVEYRTIGIEDGVERWVAATGRAVVEDGVTVRFIGTIMDIGARKAAEARLRELNETLEARVAEEVAQRADAEEALRQAQKMEAVGQLTGGIAHDFNNLLTVVTGNIGIAQRALDAAAAPDPRARRSLDNALKGAERAAALTQRLLAFSRRQPLAPKALDVDRLVVGMSDLLARSLGELVRLEIVTSPGLWRVEADPNQLESAILNLALNARDAMPAGGELAIETANARLDEAYSATQAEVPPGQYVMIAVTDNGTGMTKDVVAKAFEPFFTTKDVGQGTGLGLSMVYGFVKQSGGHLKLYSEPGQGTTAKIYLPRLVRELPDEAVATLTPGLEASPRRETILVAEDDDDVRAYTVECLRELGYRVLEAHDGDSALRLLERQGEPIDLLFTDVVMPGMSGRELVEAARATQPALRALYTSGYTRNAIVHAGRLDPGVELIVKPFTFEALGQKVRDMLDQGRTRQVLVVERDPRVRTLMSERLESAGYRSDQAANAAEALGKVRAAQGRYDTVVIADLLSDHDGAALALELRALFRDLPLLITTEGPATELVARLAGDRCVAVLQRPFTGQDLEQGLTQLGLADRPRASD